ncbi:MAG: family 16 glycosylhydrolase [Bacteroidales bacterium]|nr:family 16 glycosylhydrolase [Bacteroidales bacterium]
MASIKVLLGLYPKTEKIEATEAALIKEHHDFVEFSSSDELEHFEELEKLVKSPEFADVVKTIKGQQYKDTEEYAKEQEYLKMKNSQKFKDYFKIKKSSQLQNYLNVKESGELAEITELEEFVNSADFRQAESTSNPKEFKLTEEYQKKQRLIALKKDSKIKAYIKFKANPKCKVYEELEGSEELDKYFELEAFINTEEFKKVKDYMALKPEKKYALSDEYKAEQEYLQLKKSDKIVWYTKLKGSDKFKELESWEKSFEDDFDSSKLDEKKWMTRYYYGDKLLKDSYVLEGNQQYFTDKNLEINNSILRIVTRRENIEGNLWTPEFGFMRKEFNYTSGLINTAKSFKQKYGIFKAKVRIGQPKAIMHAFWMISDLKVPHIDVFKSNKGKINLGNFWTNGSGPDNIHKAITKVGAGKLTKDFFIYTLEWTENSLIWKINDMVIHTQTQGVPNEAMYVNFCSIIQNKIDDSLLPASMDIDWVRVYKAVEA